TAQVFWNRQKHQGKPPLFMKFHVFHGSDSFNAEAQRRKGFLGARLRFFGTARSIKESLHFS
ncbi:MAG: hypothetical protein PHS50_14905, partial [Kiritimatiellae bacterium]|nr:hypothetical protein [Kiritimatiellia bacterium]